MVAATVRPLSQRPMTTRSRTPVMAAPKRGPRGSMPLLLPVVFVMVSFGLGGSRAYAAARMSASAARTSAWRGAPPMRARITDRKSTLNSSHANISYAVFCLKKKKKKNEGIHQNKKKKKKKKKKKQKRKIQ